MCLVLLENFNYLNLVTFIIKLLIDLSLKNYKLLNYKYYLF